MVEGLVACRRCLLYVRFFTESKPGMAFRNCHKHVMYLILLVEPVQAGMQSYLSLEINSHQRE